MPGGWVSAAELVAAIHASDGSWHELEEADLQTVVDSFEKKRHEIAAGRIRAVYGHSLEVDATPAPSIPPALLFHGTSPEAVTAILRESLRPMARQFVHLSTDRNTAIEVGRRSSPTPSVLTVRAHDAHVQGIVFHQADSRIWQARAVPPDFIAHEDR